MPTKRVQVDLTAAELALLSEALDSHAYWQLSDQHYRNNGAVLGRGSDDPESRAALRRANALGAKLDALRPAVATPRLDFVNHRGE